VADDLKLKGPVREIGIERDHDRHDSFNITIGITIKTEGKVSYEEAERLSTKFRREYLGKDVEFRAIHIPCPHCDKILNSETGLKQHILKIHPEKAELLTPPKVAAKVEEPEKKGQGKKAKKPAKNTVRGSAKSKPVKAVKAGKTASAKKQKAKAEPKAKKTRPTLKPDVPEPARSRVKVEQYKPAPILGVPSKRDAAKTPQKAKQLTLA
jgi:hypothetical protein